MDIKPKMETRVQILEGRFDRLEAMIRENSEKLERLTRARAEMRRGFADMREGLENVRERVAALESNRGDFRRELDGHTRAIRRLGAQMYTRTDQQRLESKSDFQGLRTELKADIKLFRDELKAEIHVLRQELKADMSALRDEFKENLSALRDQVNADIDALRAELKADMNALRDESKADIKALRDEMKADINALRDEMKADINALRDELKADINALRQELHASIAELRQADRDLRSEMYRLHGETQVSLLNMQRMITAQTKWIIATLAGFALTVASAFGGAVVYLAPLLRAAVK